MRSPNVIQSLHQDSKCSSLFQKVLKHFKFSADQCHETVIDAKRSCFDPSAVGPGDGDFLFRAENLQYPSCGLEGTFSVEYSRINEGLLKCDIDSGTEVS